MVFSLYFFIATSCLVSIRKSVTLLYRENFLKSAHRISPDGRTPNSRNENFSKQRY